MKYFLIPVVINISAYFIGLAIGKSKMKWRYAIPLIALYAFGMNFGAYFLFLK